MVWPSPQDYSEAVQMPLSSFQDEELKESVAEVNSLGLPTCFSGNFASVFCMSKEKRKFAARCFLHDVPDQELRYGEISKFILNDDLPYTVSFEYLSNGIKIRDQWFPLLKMQWVEGITLNQYVSNNFTNSQALNLLAGYFKQMMFDLHRAGIAHGDLQHDNILVSDDELRLVDYDGMFVAALSGTAATELGHRNYQHPQRDKSTFGPFLDNFSAWIIYASLKILAIDPSLWHTLKGGDDCLLFRQSDFVSPDGKSAIAILKEHADDHVRSYSNAIESFLEIPIAEIPGLDTPLEGMRLRNQDLARLPEWVPAVIDAAEPSREIEVHSIARERREYPLYPLTRIRIDNAVLRAGSNRLRQEITSQLNAGEDVVWDYSPPPPAFSRELSGLGLLAGGVFLVGLGLLGHWGALASVTIGLMMVLVARLVASSDLPSWYGLTNIRFIMIASAPSREGLRIFSIPFDEISRIEKTGSGLIFRPTRKFSLSPLGFSEDLSLVLSPEREKSLLDMIPNRVPRSL